MSVSTVGSGQKGQERRWRRYRKESRKEGELARALPPVVGRIVCERKEGVAV